MNKLRIAAVIAATATVLTTAGLATATASAVTSSVARPNSCQAASATLTLETTARGYTYDCSGLYFLPSGTIAYYLNPNGWSGWMHTFSGSTEIDYYFCNGPGFRIPYYEVLDIYLSPTKEPWC